MRRPGRPRAALLAQPKLASRTTHAEASLSGARMDMTIEHLLTSTRSVRKRLDFSRPVERDVIARCIALALQAPTGGNQQGWHFVVVTDADKRRALADLYRQAFAGYTEMRRAQTPPPADDPRADQLPRVLASATYLAEHLHEAPVHVIPCVEGRVEQAGVLAQASTYGSILPAAWSFMLALRAHGLGTAWTTLHLMFEAQAAALLGIPDHFTQCALFPVAYYRGDDFKPAKRLPAEQMISWNAWGAR
jgi:nitroreductase